MQPPESPCIKVCVLDEADICRGCFRSRMEIARWTSMTPQEQWQVVAAAQRRRARARPAQPAPGADQPNS